VSTLITYVDKRFNASALDWIEKANVIIEEYEGAGLTLTLRQLYYQFVARGFCANTERNYKNMSRVFSDARLAGLISWTALEDRTRFLRQNPHWDNPEDILGTCASQFALDKWEDQPYRVEVWIEKDALLGVIDRICEQLDVPYFSCRGYTSQSEQWRAGMRFKRYIDAGQEPVVLHLGDHDPSGMDMTRDNEERLSMFAGMGVEMRRLALNFDQVRKYNPPPNPTKLTDSRAEGYIGRFGHECWELDALDPKVLVKLVSSNVLKLRDTKLWEAMVKREQEHKDNLQQLTENYEDILKYLNDR
jgi:hypothetical protein